MNENFESRSKDQNESNVNAQGDVALWQEQAKARDEVHALAPGFQLDSAGRQEEHPCGRISRHAKIHSEGRFNDSASATQAADCDGIRSDLRIAAKHHERDAGNWLSGPHQ